MTDTLARGPALSVGSVGLRASGWWGACFLILSEASLFAYLLFSYFYLSVQPSAGWVPGGPPSIAYPAAQTAAVLVGCVTAAFADRSMSRGEKSTTQIWLVVTLLLGAAFIVFQLLDWFGKPFGFANSTYSSEYFAITGLHLAHVLVGWVMFLLLLIWTSLGYFGPIRHVPITIGKLYWYFLAALWVAVFFVINITPFFFG